MRSKLYKPNPFRASLAVFFGAIALGGATLLSLPTSGSAANGTPSYFDVDGTTAGFGTASGSYNVNSSSWNNNDSTGTSATAAFVNGRQKTFGAAAGDFAGDTFTINFNVGNPPSWSGLVVNSTSANITLSGSSNFFLNANNQTWTVAAGSTLNENVTWGTDGLNFNNRNLALNGGGTINFGTAVGKNSNATITQNGPTVNLLAAGSTTNPNQAHYTLASGNLNFGNAASADAFKTMSAGRLFSINGGVIDNTSGAARTLDLGAGTYSIGGDFTFTGSSDLNLGTDAVALSGNRQLTVTANTLTIGGTVSGGAGLTKAGGGTLAVNGNYTGGNVTVSGGILQVNSPSGDGFNANSGNGVITVNNGATLQYTGSNKLHNGTRVQVDGGGVFDFNNQPDAIAYLSGSGNVTLGTATVVLDLGTGHGNQDFSGMISGNGGVTVRGNNVGASSTTQTFSGANSYLGTTTIDNGTLRIESTGSLPGSTVVNSPGTLQLFNSGTTSWSNNITGNGTVNLEFDTPGGNAQLTDIGTFDGTVETTLSGASTGSKWRVSSVNAPNASAIINPGTQLFVVGNNTLEGVSVSGTGNTENRGAIRLNNNSSLTAPITLLGDATIGPEGANSGVINGTISLGVVTPHTLRLGTTNSFEFRDNMLNGVISDGSGTLALSVFNQNEGAIFISGAAANTYSGGTTLLNSGSGTRLRIGSITGTPYGTGAITIGQAATDKAGIYFVTAGQTLTNDIVFNTALGTDRPGVRSDATNINLPGTITANLAPATFSTNNTGSFNLTGQVTGASGLTLDNDFGSSITVTLNNAAMNNNYQGDTTIEGTKGTLVLGASNQIPNGATAGNLVNNGTFNMNGFSDTVNGLSGSGTVEGGSGNPTLTVGANNASSSFSGVIQNTAGSLAFAKTGTGDTTLTGTNSYSNGTTVEAGRLILTGSGSVGSGNVTVDSGGELFTAVAGTLNNNFFISGDGGNSSLDSQPRGALRIENTTIGSSGSVTLQADSSIGSYNGGTGTINAAISESGGSRALTINKSTLNSPGTIILGGDNSYTGNTDVIAGTFALVSTTSNNNIASSPTITVASGATLDVSGITTPGGFQLVSSQTLAGEGTVIGATTLLGELSPGGNSVGTLFFDDLDVSGTDDLLFDLGSTGDLVDLTDASNPTLTIGPLFGVSDFSFSQAGGFGPGTYTLFDTNVPITGMLTPGDTNYSFGPGVLGILSFADGTNDLVLNVTIIPEPTALVLGILGLLGLGLRRRRRARR